MKKDFEYIPDHIFNKTDYEKMPAHVFEKYLKQEVEIKRFCDKIEVTLPFVCDIFDKITFVLKSVDDKVIEICDNGIAIKSLCNKVDDLAKFKDWLDDFENHNKRIKFVSGTNMTLTVWGANSFYAVQQGIFDMLSYASIVANADLYPLTKAQAQGGAK